MIGHKLKNRYEILETLAHGANSTTYKARDTFLNRDVSLKVLSQLKDEARERFFQQARAVARLSHPNIAAVYDADTDSDGTAFVVTEYVEGKPLSDFMPTTPEDMVQVGRQLAAALNYAHQQGIIHADLNPTNIRITPDGQAKILDLGLRLAETSSTITATGALIGNPAYLSPEQVQGVAVDARSDIYALGAILYELATGQPPFKGDTPVAVLIQQVTQPPAPPQTIAPDISAGLAEVILKALEKDPARRYESAEALASALGDALEGPRPRRIAVPSAPPAPAAPPPLQEAPALEDAESPPPLHQPAPEPEAAPPPPPPQAAPSISDEPQVGALPSPPMPPQAAPIPAGQPKPGAVPAPVPQPAATQEMPRQAAPPPQPIRFSAHYPKEVRPNDWQPLHAYLYKESAEKAVAEDANKQLGSRAPLFRKLVQTAKQIIQEGETVTATPNMPGFQFNPPSASVAFFEDWHRFDFKLRAHTAPLNQSTNGLLTFTVAGVIVADIPLSIFVGEAASEGEQASASSKPYQAVFCSYSHNDTHIVERVERAYKALGLDYLRDVVSLKSGTHWSEELLQLIEKADIFQLFWSEAAAQSKYVQQEWQYALKLNRDQAHFIRPVYWRQPMPPPPPPMSHIHFAYQPDLEK
jgi:serine/threonine protein kinase